MGRESPVCRGIGTPGRALTKVFTGRVTAGLLASRARVASARRGTGCLILTTKCWGVNGPTRCADHRSKRFGHSSIRLPCRGARGTKCWVFSGRGGAVVSRREALSPEAGMQGRDLRPWQADLRDAGCSSKESRRAPGASRGHACRGRDTASRR